MFRHILKCERGLAGKRCWNNANAGIAGMLRKKHTYLPNPNDLATNIQHFHPTSFSTILPNAHPPPTSLFPPQDV
jgi:hypothetical protein